MIKGLVFILYAIVILFRNFLSTQSTGLTTKHENLTILCFHGKLSCLKWSLNYFFKSKCVCLDLSTQITEHTGLKMFHVQLQIVVVNGCHRFITAELGAGHISGWKAARFVLSALPSPSPSLFSMSLLVPLSCTPVHMSWYFVSLTPEHLCLFLCLCGIPVWIRANKSQLLTAGCEGSPVNQTQRCRGITSCRVKRVWSCSC